MTGKERIISVLEGKEPDTIPFALFYGPRYLNKISGIHPAYLLYGPPEYSIKAHIQVHKRHNDDWILAPTHIPREYSENNVIKFEGEKVFVENKEKGERWEFKEDWRLVKEKDYTSTPPTGGSRTMGAKRYMSCDEWIESGHLDVLKGVKDKVGDDTFIAFYAGNVFAAAIEGFESVEKAFITFAESPEKFVPLLEEIASSQCEKIKAGAKIGADGVWISEMYAGSDMISPSAYEKYVFPIHRKLTEEAKKQGLFSFFYFMGDPFPLFPKIKELPVDCLSFDSKAKGKIIDIGKIAEYFSDKFCIRGNIDAVYVLQKGDREEIRNAVREQLKNFPKKRYILGNDSPITPETEPEKIDFLREAGRELWGKV